MQRLLRETTFTDYLTLTNLVSSSSNGGNWGCTIPGENDDHHWVKLNYGYDDDEIDLPEGKLFRFRHEVKRGSTDAFGSWPTMLRRFRPPILYSTIPVASMMDLQNMADYFIAETYLSERRLDGSEATTT